MWHGYDTVSELVFFYAVSSTPKSTHSQLPELHFPLPSETGVPCLVKVCTSDVNNLPQYFVFILAKLNTLSEQELLNSVCNATFISIDAWMGTRRKSLRPRRSPPETEILASPAETRR